MAPHENTPGSPTCGGIAWKATTWEGVTFRSRLECQWSIFFTRMSWGWKYEPDLGLKGWLPDFGLSFRQPVLVEIKPEKTLHALLGAAVKARRRHLPCEVLVLGLEPNIKETGAPREQGYLGALWSPGEEGRRIQQYAVSFRCAHCRMPSFYGTQTIFCRVCGEKNISASFADSSFHNHAWRAGENTMERVRRANKSAQ